MNKDILTSLYHRILQLKGTKTRNAPLEETLGIPQRSYGYTQGRIRYLQTGNINYCIALLGHNENGAFLAHIDNWCFKRGQIPQMLENLDRVLHAPFDMTLVYNKGEDKRQRYVKELKQMLLPLQKRLSEKRKSSVQILNLGVDKTGNIYYPENHVANEALDELEQWFYIRGGVGQSPEYYYRYDLGCVNQSKGTIIPSEGFTEEQLPKWINFTGSRKEVMKKVMRFFRLTPKDYIEMALGRPYSSSCQDGALVLV